GTIRATASRCANLGNESDHADEPGCRLEGGQQLQPLGLGQRRQLREQLLEPGRLHDPLPLTTTGVGPRTCSAVQYSSISNVDSAFKLRPDWRHGRQSEADQISSYSGKVRNSANWSEVDISSKMMAARS